jgi:hypothetical protein
VLKFFRQSYPRLFHVRSGNGHLKLLKNLHIPADIHVSCLTKGRFKFALMLASRGLERVLQMPMESRVLHFAQDEVLEALKGYCAQTDRSMPEDPGGGFVLFRDEASRLTLGSSDREISTAFTESEVGAALIMFCMKKDIPIARHSIKSLHVGKDHVLLRLDIRP